MHRSARLWAPWVFVLFVLGAIPVFAAAPETGGPEWDFDGVAKIVAVGDVHGAHEELLLILRSTGLVDEAGQWSGGETHLVSLGDLVDRGADSRAVLDLLMRLEGEARAAGGRVHVVPGNHEVLNVTGDLRYVAPGEYAAFAADETDDQRRDGCAALAEPAREACEKRYPAGWFAHRAAFSPEGVYGRFLVSRPTFVRIDDLLFVHGGFSEDVLELSPEALASRIGEETRRYVACREDLIEAGALAHVAPFVEHLAVAERLLVTALLEGTKKKRRRKKGVDALEAARCILGLRLDGLAFTNSGPLWYRGLAEHDAATESAVLDAVLAHLGGKRVVVGHTPTPSSRVESRLDGRVIVLDTGMLVEYYEGRPSALVIENGLVTAVYPGTEIREPPRTGGPGVPGEGGVAWRDRVTSHRLNEAEIVEVETLSTGVTGARRATLRDDAGTLRAVFKWYDSYSDTAAQRNPLKRIGSSDRWQYELAAYRLDRLLHIGLVPVTVPREVEGREGVLQEWIENARDDRARRAGSIVPSDGSQFLAQQNVMDAFDVLIHNEDRHSGNVLYTLDPWRTHLIDHTRAFRARTERPAKLRKRQLIISTELRQRLLLLDRDTLEELLGEWLESLQIRSILERRDTLLREALDPE